MTGEAAAKLVVLKIIVFCIPVAASDPLAHEKVTELASVVPVVNPVAAVGWVKSGVAEVEVYIITSSQNTVAVVQLAVTLLAFILGLNVWFVPVLFKTLYVNL